MIVASDLKLIGHPYGLQTVRATVEMTGRGSISMSTKSKGVTHG